MLSFIKSYHISFLHMLQVYYIGEYNIIHPVTMKKIKAKCLYNIFAKYKLWNINNPYTQKGKFFFLQIGHEKKIRKKYSKAMNKG